MTEKMMPGQEPYTLEESKQRASLIRDAATNDPGELNETFDARSFDYTDEQLRQLVETFRVRGRGPITYNDPATVARLAAQLLDTRIMVRKTIQKLKDLCS